MRNPWGWTAQSWTYFSSLPFLLNWLCFHSVILFFSRNTTVTGVLHLVFSSESHYHFVLTVLLLKVILPSHCDLYSRSHAFCQLALWCWWGHDLNYCSTGGYWLQSLSIQYHLSHSTMTSLSTETAEILKVIRISPQVAAEQTNNAVLSTCQRLVLQCRNYSLPITVFSPYMCRHARPFSVKWKSHSPNSFEFKYESYGHELKAAWKQFPLYWWWLNWNILSWYQF